MSKVICPNCSHHSYHLAKSNQGKPSLYFISKWLLKWGYVPSFIYNFPIQCDICDYSWKA